MIKTCHMGEMEASGMLQANLKYLDPGVSHQHMCAILGPTNLPAWRTVLCNQTEQGKLTFQLLPRLFSPIIFSCSAKLVSRWQNRPAVVIRNLNPKL